MSRHVLRVRQFEIPYATVAGLVILVGILVAGFALPLPYDPIEPDAAATSLPPNAHHLFGTDSDGFDVFARTINAATKDLPLALIGTVASLIIGVLLGLAASNKSKASERVMRALDLFQAFPLVVLALAIVTVTGNDLKNVVLAIMIINVPRFMRLVRSEALTIRESKYVEAARSYGASGLRILRCHIFPNVKNVILVQASLGAAQAIIVIASLSFLGVGVSPPQPSWGLMLQDGARNVTTGQWWTVVFPGAAILLAVISFNLIADGLQARHEQQQLQ